jgi:hypothetical protein
MEKQTTQMIQAGIGTALTRLAKDDTTPSWIVRSIRARSPDLARLAVRNYLYASVAAKSRNDPSQRIRVESAPKLSADVPGQVDKAIEAYARSLVTYTARYGRDSAEILLHSAAWSRSLPCCSKAPIWPFCRRNC